MRTMQRLSSEYPLMNGAGERNRTADLRVTSALLYQLSYTGAERYYIGSAPGYEPTQALKLARMAFKVLLGRMTFSSLSASGL